MYSEEPCGTSPVQIWQHAMLFSKQKIHHQQTCITTNNNNNNDRLTAFDPGQPG